MARWYDDFPRYAPSRPRQAKGGIRSQSQRGSFAESWWGKRWIQVLESFPIGGRLARGRSYARQGQVLSIQIDSGAIQASVQGSRPKPYSISIAVKTLSAREWEKFVHAVSSQAIFAAKLLAGEMPREIEEAFQSQKLSLFPERFSDLKMECSCPDWEVPCKHIAAVYYLLGEEFDRDPFLIFKLRGMTREQIAASLGERSTPAPPAEPADPPEPLPAGFEAFWRPFEPSAAMEPVTAPALNAVLLRRLGRFPFWTGERAILDALDPLYLRASAQVEAKLGGPAST